MRIWRRAKGSYLSLTLLMKSGREQGMQRGGECCVISQAQSCWRMTHREKERGLAVSLPPDSHQLQLRYGSLSLFQTLSYPATLVLFISPQLLSCASLRLDHDKSCLVTHAPHNALLAGAKLVHNSAQAYLHRTAFAYPYRYPRIPKPSSRLHSRHSVGLLRKTGKKREGGQWDR